MTKKKILIIDDDISALDIVDFLFEDQGFEVVRSTDGPTALDTIEDAKPDIVLIDLMMPEMNGQECIAKLRERGWKIPIIAFTAVDDTEVHDEARDAGCDLVLVKPCKPAKLVSHVEKLLNQQDA